MLEEAEFLTITTDTWTSLCVENYMTVTAHYVDKEWCFKSILLECFNFPQQHTAENIRNELLTILQNWNVSERVHTVVTDNARNVTAAVKLTGWNHLPCLAHTLNLVVQDAMKVIEEFHKKVKHIVEYFHRSCTAAAKLRDMQNQMLGKSLKLVMDVVTRWNSSFQMFKRLCEIQAPLDATLGVLHNPVDTLNAEEWLVLQEFCFILKPFDEITTELSSETQVTVSKIIPMISGLYSFINRTDTIKSTQGTNLKNQLLLGLSSRFNKLEYNSLLSKSTALDPRFKKKLSPIIMR